MIRHELHSACMALPGVRMDVQWGDDHVYKVADWVRTARGLVAAKLTRIQRAEIGL